MSVSSKTRASEKFAALSNRAEEAGERVAAAQHQAEAEVERHANDARASAKAHTEKLGESADTEQSRVSGSWQDVQKSWSRHLDKVNEHVKTGKHGFDATAAVNDAESADSDAIAAVDFAYSAVELAEASVLDAISAWKKADDVINEQ